jgi:hypothetical protein
MACSAWSASQEGWLSSQPGPGAERRKREARGDESFRVRKCVLSDPCGFPSKLSTVLYRSTEFSHADPCLRLRFSSDSADLEIAEVRP